MSDLYSLLGYSSAIAQNNPSSLTSGTCHSYTPSSDFQHSWSVKAVTLMSCSRTKDSAIECNKTTKMENRAINCIECGDGLDTRQPMQRSSDLDRLVASAISDRTRRAYANDLNAFEGWLGRSVSVAPAANHEVAEFIAAMTGQFKPATITRRLASISKAHRAMGLPSPTSSELVQAAMRGMRRQVGTAQRKAQPLLKEDLIDILDRLPDTLKALRDRALLLIGFAGGFRRSELVGLDVTDIEHVRQGIVVNLRRSKTDQEGRGRKIGIPFARGRHCPVRALEAWVKASDFESGAIFRPVSRHGHIDLGQRLSTEAVAIVVKEAVAKIGHDPEQFSGHSLRAGLVTSAAMAGIPLWKIRKTTGHTSNEMLGRYIRDADLFTDNAAGIL